jgi:hypothetical protein
MKRMLQRLLVGTSILVCLFGASVSEATTTVFSAPAQYCFPKGVLRGELSQTTLDYTFVVPAEDQLKQGHIFVGFRMKSSGNIWLYGFGAWAAYDSAAPVAYYGGTLLPILLLHVIPDPTNLTSFAGDGEVLVGYGLGTTTSSSFQDMTSNQRYSTIWQVGTQPLYSHICLTTTQMTEFSGTVSTSSAR